ncbi:DUF1828 domain-containing protein [Candidatus Tisiphia endosymbiont of Nedyus quadrimaculatus]|uniref:DUF1828 domain-containing protein n=1 Tax=Candidatus Tisiphia endosymbiont of Nedyus quadrimaculatus TaxID=3139332 RepID=UPI00345EB07A
MTSSLNIEHLLENYYKWLRDKTAWKQLKDWLEITTPYLDRHNDYIQIYLKQEGNSYILTDDSWTIDDLEQSGCLLDSDRRQKFLEMTLNGFGVHKNNNEMFVKTNQQNFALAKHNLIQAILAVNDMFYLARPNIASLFYEDVQMWLDACDIRYSERVAFLGQSGYLRHFDFLIPKSKYAPERMIQTVNTPNKNKATSIMGDWFDTREVRSSDAKAYTFINDNEKPIPENFQDALKNYQIIPVPWSKRDNFKSELAA